MSKSSSFISLPTIIFLVVMYNILFDDDDEKDVENRTNDEPFISKETKEDIKGVAEDVKQAIQDAKDSFVQAKEEKKEIPQEKEVPQEKEFEGLQPLDEDPEEDEDGLKPLN